MAKSSAAGQQSAGVDSTIERASERVHESVDRAASAAAEAAERLSETLQERRDQLAELRDDWVDTAREYVRENPFKAIGIAVAAGYLLSLLTRSR